MHMIVRLINERTNKQTKTHMRALGDNTYHSGGPASATVVVTTPSGGLLTASGSNLDKLVDMGEVGVCESACLR